MGIRHLRNRHESWRHFCQLHRETLVIAGLPDAIALSEERFRNLLEDGVASSQGSAASLSALSSEQWGGLSAFAAVFFHEFESWAPLEQFPAYRKEAERRAADVGEGAEATD